MLHSVTWMNFLKWNEINKFFFQLITHKKQKPVPQIYQAVVLGNGISRIFQINDQKTPEKLLIFCFIF